jgi:hypothetical protein
MEESASYQWIVRKGERRGQQATLLRIGRRLLGEPDAATVAAVQAITDLERLDRLADRVVEVSSWADLLATP